MDEAARERLVQNAAGHIAGGVEEPVLSRVFEYWSNVDEKIGQRIRDAVLAQKG
ncbi:catalase-related domain-containing protein [Asaia prunellae]|uniref:catalase-related domain-containing protein n=1 Tax=Asaia prunellae TaxID=610245 RepID=UPI000A5C2E13|nr:catalase-related domain-containing protein [Asaia prunellae]